VLNQTLSAIGVMPGVAAMSLKLRARLDCLSGAPGSTA
jgi:hypothetical protein